MSNAEQSRKYRERIAQEQGKTLRPYRSTGIESKDKTEWRREYKRMKRRETGATPRIVIQAAAQAKRDEAKTTKEQREARTHLHDAHVKRYKYVLDVREKYAKKYANNPQAERDRASRYKKALPDPYVIQNLKVMGIPSHAITPSLIAMKREAMQYGRLSREIKSTVKTYLKDNHETIPKHP